MMNSEKPVYLTRAWVNGVQQEVSINVRQLEKAIALFSANEEAYAAFQSYIERIKADPNQHVPIDGFESALIDATDKGAGFGSLLWFRVWEELLNRHGVPTDWSSGGNWRL